MPSPRLLTYDEYGAALGSASTVLRNNAMAAGLAAGVPTCPDWTVADLVVHQGMVHRWAQDVLEGRGARGADGHAEDGRAAEDLLDWFDTGATGLLQTLATAAPDLDVPFFLADAPSPRVGWCRRQAHETTVHAVDAMAARLGRAPRSSEVWFTDALALDGIDELLTGFLPRAGARLRSDAPYALEVRPDGTDRTWRVAVSTAPPVSTRDIPEDGEDARLVVTGPAREVYLGLWNRGPLTTSGDEAVVDQWRSEQRVRW